MISMTGRRDIGSMSAFLAAILVTASASAADLKIGLRADPDALDPATGGSVAGRVIFAALCDKLIDTTPEGTFQPQLATSWSWSPDSLTLTLKLRDQVVFHDGQPMDAAAVKVNLDRYRTDPISRRKTELKPVASVDVIDPLTVAIKLSQAYAPLVSVLADRAGMIMSPAALAKDSANIGAHPVCAGPFQFVERVSQDHITLKRFDQYWNKDAISLDSVTYRMIPDDAVRLLSLRSGDLDLIERLSPSDVAAIKDDRGVKAIEGPSIAFDVISINIAHGESADNPLGRNAKVRQALELSIDRGAISEVVYEGLFPPANQTEPVGAPYYDPTHALKGRDVARAKMLLAEAGVTSPSFTLSVANSPTLAQVGQMVQVMAAEAGFDVKIQSLESSTLAANSDAGKYQASMAIWSGRPDPDGNISPWVACDGFLNWGRYCNPALDKLLAQARQVTDEKERAKLYAQSVGIYLTDVPFIPLYHYKSIWAARSNVDGFVPYPDGLIRLQGVRKS
ncbi:ABC transporter substrate-binding protein [Neorhizobium sp. Rsf11]|uniref:ABC transporter substrate-binding protein n=2 Tax=Neorhizobium TaxID=1525371 RepID=A0ABV0LZC1_9HYPH|nr:ABC transporter substrate-binding protein [Neorhizobium petrolearium]MCC2610893.1 ABC transporter substrate-binding protein [Neorhizobium petrolearium]WGI71007.1 ABC transporter substrate-binding protein [Neorhizobium petrolearium]